MSPKHRIVFFVAAIFDALLLLFSGIYEDNNSAIGQGVGYIIYIVVISIFISRNVSFSFKSLQSNNVHNKKNFLSLQFVLVGWFFAMIDEIVFYLYNPLFEGVSLIGDLILTTGPYLLAHLGWYSVHKRYKFSWFQSLITGGLALLIGEEIFGNFILSSPIMGIILLPSFIFMHGFHMFMPPYLLRNELDKLNRKDTKIKYLFGIVLPLMGYMIGAIFILLGQAIGIN
ncbi:MAG: hypothetical protein ACTSU2_03175 [Promethearchaeota archaeon]